MSKSGSCCWALELAMSMTELRLASATGEMSPSIFSSVAQDCWPSTRQRQNFTASAGTNGGGLASFGFAAMHFDESLPGWLPARR